MKKINLLIAAVLVILICSSCEKEEVNVIEKGWETEQTATSSYVTSPKFTVYLFDFTEGVEKSTEATMRVYGDYTFDIVVPDGFFSLKDGFTVGYQIDLIADNRIAKQVYFLTKDGLISNNNGDNGYEFISYMMNTSTTIVNGENNRQGIFFRIEFELNTSGLRDEFNKL